MGEFARRVGVSYDVMRSRLRHGNDLFAPVSTIRREDEEDDQTKGYTLDELVELYRGFAGDEEELQILADFACTDRKHAVKLLKKIKKRIQEIYEEVRG